MSTPTVNDSPALRTDCVRMLGIVVKNPSISYEEFERHWLEKHSQLFLSLDIVKKNLLKYEQFHINQQTKTLLQSLGVTLIDCDGAAMIEGPSYEKLFEVFNDAEFKAIIETDEERFLDRSKSRILPIDFVSFINK